VRWGAYNGGLRATQGGGGRQTAAQPHIGPGGAGKVAVNGEEFADADLQLSLAPQHNSFVEQDD
jgi:hypothetical protein